MTPQSVGSAPAHTRHVCLRFAVGRGLRLSTGSQHLPLVSRASLIEVAASHWSFVPGSRDCDLQCPRTELRKHTHDTGACSVVLFTKDL